MVAGEEALSAVVEWYRGAGSVRSVKRGLDSRSFIIEVSGRKEMRILAVAYDPSTDEDIREFVDSLLDSYRRARISFDRLDLWVPAPLYAEAQRLLEEAERRGVDWASRVALRPFTPPGDLMERTGGIGGTDLGSKERPRVHSIERRAESPSRRVFDEREIGLLVQELGREIGEGIARSLQDSLREIISSIDTRRSDPELISRLHELEKRVELLESFIRLLGSHGIASTSHIQIETPRARERPQVPRMMREDEERHPRIEEVKLGEMIERERVAADTSAEDVLEEIFNNPWVSILRKKGEGLEGEGD